MRLFAALLLTAAAASPVAAASLIVNGGFEADALANGTFAQYFGGSSFTGWDVVGTQALTIENDYAEGSIRTNANTGDVSLDLTGAGSGSPTTGVNQDVATVTGQTYTLSFFVGNLSGDGASAGLFDLPTTVVLSIDGGAGVQFTNAAVTQNLINWAQFTTNFVAAGMTTNIAFFNSPTPDNHTALDDVTLVATIVPEPATWALMVAGFGLVGGALRRRVPRAA